MTQDAPWLAVLIPVYNGAATLKDTLASVAVQGAGVQVVLVDQGSTDGSRAIAEGFQDRLDLRIIDAPDNKNWVQNTNQALAAATADYACLLHQDDVWAPGRVALMGRMIADWPKAALWLHGADYIDASGRIIGALDPPVPRREAEYAPQDTLRWLLVQNTIALPAPVFRRADALGLGGLKEALWYTADWEFWLALARLGPLAYTPRRAVRFRLHGKSLTLSGSRDLDDFADQLARPVALHLPAVEAGARGQVAAMAAASNMVNLWLASRFHANPRPLGPVLRHLLALGPVGMVRLLRQSRIWARMRPRLRLMRGRVPRG